MADESGSGDRQNGDEPDFRGARVDPPGAARQYVSCLPFIHGSHVDAVRQRQLPDVVEGLHRARRDQPRAVLPTTGTFSSLSMGSAAPALPSPWTASDIGNPSTPGGASESGGTFTVSGAGTDIFNSSDQFQFVSQPVTGDTQIVAKVASFVAYDTLAKAGVMIRADLTASAANASMFATASSTWVSQTRLIAGASTFQAPGPASAPPGWVKVVREGDTLSTFQSPDGTSWTLVNSDTIPMPSTVYVGLAVTGRSTTPATATFSNVTVSAPPASNNPPTVSITAPVSALGSELHGTGKHDDRGDCGRFGRFRCEG